jgi:hypothetical protein
MLIPILALAASPIVAPAESEYVVLRNATVHTFEPGESPSVRSVLLENDRIAAIGAQVEVPAGARVVDLAGMHLLPGLVDGMVNFDADHDRLYLSAGVTLVRDVGNDLGRMLIESTREARERNPGPWIFGAGAVLDGAPAATLNSIVMENAQIAEQKLDALLSLEEPPDYLSYLPGLPRPAWEVALRMGHAAHREVWGTMPRGMTLAEVAAAGQDGVFHLDAFLPAGKTWETVTDEELQPAIEVAVKNHVAVTPTLALWARAVVEPKEDSPQLELLSPFYEETWGQDAVVRRRGAFRDRLAAGLAIVETQGRLVKALHDRGVALVPGTATPNPWLFPGEALLDELALWHKAGIGVEDCIRAATAGACETLGIVLRGSIRKGKYADLIAVKHDPRESIGALYRPDLVVVRGRVLERNKLDAFEDELRATQKLVRAELAQEIEVGEPELPEGDVILTGHVETRAIGVRLSGEKFGVVRRFDGALVYCGRLRTLGQGGLPDTLTTVSQVISDGFLKAFDVRMSTGARVTEVKGEIAGGRMNISRSQDGLPVDNVPVLPRLALVDCGSVTAWLIVGYHRKPGEFQVLFFENYEPATGPWQMALEPDPTTHVLRMLGSGEAIVKYDGTGVPTEILRATGNGVARTQLIEAEIVDGRGLPMPADKRALAPPKDAAAKPTEAGSPPRQPDGGAPAPK